MSLDFEAHLGRLLDRASPHAGVRDVLRYAVLPAGKLFRPRLAEAMGTDLGTAPHLLLHLGAALELHHAYSLVHDDLPCMDDDDVRRGRPSTHRAHGEWRALLAGDALLALSYAELERLESPRAAQVRRLFHWATGPKGLILGQWLDLGLEAQSAPQAVRMHELKTGRLIQTAVAGAGLLAPSPMPTRQGMRLGSALGVAFQLLDDLDDLTTAEITAHEAQVNPFLSSPTTTFAALARARSTLNAGMQDLPRTRAFVGQFMDVSLNGLRGHRATLERRLPHSSEALRTLLG